MSRRQPPAEVGPQLEAAVGLLETYGEYLTVEQWGRVIAKWSVNVELHHVPDLPLTDGTVPL